MSRSEGNGLRSTSCAEGSHARTCRAPEDAPGSTESDPDSGGTSPPSSRRSARDSSSSRTSRAERSYGCLTFGTNCTCSATERVPSALLPPTSARRTFGGVSSLLPTPAASNYGSNQGGAAGRVGKIRYSLRQLAKRGELMATPTETANQLSPSMAKWPGCAAWQAVHPPGPLLPSFVEWMMGFPVDWTDCELSETPSSRSRRTNREEARRCRVTYVLVTRSPVVFPR